MKNTSFWKATPLLAEGEGKKVEKAWELTNIQGAEGSRKNVNQHNTAGQVLQGNVQRMGIRVRSHHCYTCP